MNFLIRSTTTVYSERSPIPEPRVDTHQRSASAGSSYEAHKSDVPYSSRYDPNVELNSKNRDLPEIVVDKHVDVDEDDGWITIPCKELPENWDHVPDIQSLRSLDRSFLFPGEQVHILACLSACKQDTLFTAPFEVAATTSKNGIDHSHEKESGSIENRHNLVSEEGELSTSGEEQPADIFYGDSLRHREVHKRQIALLLQKFENSHFFVRICESNEPLWSRRNSLEKNSSSSETNNQKVSIIKTKETAFPSTGAVIDRGNFDATTCGGTARNFVKCFALQNGDIVDAGSFTNECWSSSKPNFDHEDWDQVSSQKVFWKKTGKEELLSFRGVSLERDRFSVCCGLEGVYIPGRRWRRKLEIIQPVKIHSYAADFNSEDLLSVQIKNVAPAYAPDIVIFIDAINIIFEESTKNGEVSSLPISCVEAGNDHSLPNLALRRGEEHSFILKAETSKLKSLKAQYDRSSRLSKLPYGNKISKLSHDQYAIMVSCRCNYTSSRLFFKQPTSWRPRSSRDIMISIASQMSGKSRGDYDKTYQLPVQILTLQASNLTSEDLTLTVLAPASFTSPSVVSLNSPRTPKSPFIGFAEFLARVNGERRIGSKWKKGFNSIIKKKVEQSYDGKAQEVSLSDDVIPSSGISCTHLWLQSRVPLGCIPSKSVVTVKLELLPLTDGIITLDSLQIDVKEKGVAYIPESSLKINSTSGMCKGIM